MQTRVAGERSREQLAEAKARAGALDWSMQVQASAAREQADAINATEAGRVEPIAQLRGRSQNKTDFILAQALEQQQIAEKEMH